VLIVSVGLYLFTMPGEAAFNSGDVLILLCAVVFAFYIVYLDVFTKDGFDREIVFYQFVVTSLMAFVLTPVLDSTPAHFTLGAMGSVLYLAFFASTVAIFIQSKYQRETTPTKAAIIFSLEPVIAAIIAYFVLSEVMGAIEVIGAVVMFAGLLISELMPSKAGEQT